MVQLGPSRTRIPNWSTSSHICLDLLNSLLYIKYRNNELQFQVDIVVSRDLDSRFNEREYASVQKWLNSNQTFHIMRDHPHHDRKFLAGMWGVKLNQQSIREKWSTIWVKSFDESFKFLLWSNRNNGEHDQNFLAR